MQRGESTETQVMLQLLEMLLALPSSGGERQARRSEVWAWRRWAAAVASAAEAAVAAAVDAAAAAAAAMDFFDFFCSFSFFHRWEGIRRRRPSRCCCCWR